MGSRAGSNSVPIFSNRHGLPNLTAFSKLRRKSLSDNLITSRALSFSCEEVNEYIQQPLYNTEAGIQSRIIVSYLFYIQTKQNKLYSKMTIIVIFQINLLLLYGSFFKPCCIWIHVIMNSYKRSVCPVSNVLQFCLSSMSMLGVPITYFCS